MSLHPSWVQHTCPTFLQASGSLSELSGLGEGFEGELQVFLVNSKSVSVKVGTYDRTDQVLERVCQEIQLASDLTYYFALFMEKQEEGEETWTCMLSQGTRGPSHLVGC